MKTETKTMTTMRTLCGHCGAPLGCETLRCSADCQHDPKAEIGALLDHSAAQRLSRRTQAMLKASPDLYEACKALLEALADSYQSPSLERPTLDAIELARAALAKADGAA